MEELNDPTLEPSSLRYKILCSALSLYYQFMDNYEEAIPFEKRVLEVNKALLGESAIETSESY